VDISLTGYQEVEIRKTGNQDCESTGHLEKPVAGFEKLWVWQKAHKLMQEIHNFCKTLPRDERFRLRDQIERCSSSVCDNIAEGYTAYYYNDKIKGFYTARKEAGETQNQIRKLSGKDYLDSEQSQKWVEEYEEVIRGINGYVRYIREKKGAQR
jgi:four helix bundle protein